jgi:hypothetical protein
MRRQLEIIETGKQLHQNDLEHIDYTPVGFRKVAGNRCDRRKRPSWISFALTREDDKK